MNTATLRPSRTAILYAWILLAQGIVRPQEKTHENGWEFLPETNRFRPLTANWQEARLGIRKQTGSSNMRLDVGAGLEFLRFRADPADGFEGRAGVEIFAYGLSTSVEGHRLQIDALDGYFGGSVAVFFHEPWGTLSARLRIMHLSSHFVDGHVVNGWTPIDGRDPTAFTRDFGELVVAPELSTGGWYFRPYAGVSYSTLVRPDDLERWGGVGGGEVFLGSFPGNLFGRPSALYLAVHTTLAGNPEFALSTAVEAGVHMGDREGAAIRVFTGYFNGNDIFHQYYDLRREYWTLGISFEVR